MEGQRERTSSRRRQRRKAKAARGKAVVEPVLIAARRPDSPLLKSGYRSVVASAQPKSIGVAASPSPQHYSAESHTAEGARPASNGHAESRDAAAQAGLGTAAAGLGAELGEPSAALDADTENAHAGGAAASNGARGVHANGSLVNGSPVSGSPVDGSHTNGSPVNGSNASEPGVIRRRAVRIVKVTDNVLTPGNREQQLLDRLVRSQGRGAISRAADDLWESKFVAPKRQEVQIQLLEHENEQRARDAVFIMAELLQREAPIKRPVLEQRLRRLETAAEDPITRDAAGALRRSMRVHHGL